MAPRLEDFQSPTPPKMLASSLEMYLRNQLNEAHAEIEWLRALAQSNMEPVAWQLVPKKPTKEMIQAAYARQHDGTTVLYFKMWNAMLDAAPAPPRPDAAPAPPCPDASAEIAELRERSLENNRLAFQWMERHDKVVGFISKNYPSVMLPNLPFPSPVTRPDASAGLIEAAEWHEKEMSRDSYYARRIHEDSAKHFRARAADRSGK